jgi:hypothetical protein
MAYYWPGFILVFGPWAHWQAEGEGLHVGTTSCLKTFPQIVLTQDSPSRSLHSILHAHAKHFERIIVFQGTIVTLCACLKQIR